MTSYSSFIGFNCENRIEQSKEIMQYVHSWWSVRYPPKAKLRSSWNGVGGAARFTLTYKEKDNEAVPAKRWIWTTKLCNWSVSELEKRSSYPEGCVVSDHRQREAERPSFLLALLLYIQDCHFHPIGWYWKKRTSCKVHNNREVRKKCNCHDDV